MATIIKGDSQFHASGQPVRTVMYDFADWSQQGEAYLEQVRLEATKIIQKAKVDAAEVRAHAEEVGRKAARAEIEKILDEKVAQQMRSLKPAIEEAVEQILDARGAWQQQWETNLTKLACALAGRIVRREIANEPAISLQWIREALTLASTSGETTLRMNPHDLSTLRDQAMVLANTASPTRPAEIVPDESISPGGCKVVTQFGAIDQQLEAQLERIATELGLD